MDESIEFSNLVASVKFTINRPPLADIIERPKSSLPISKVSPLAVSLTFLAVAIPDQNLIISIAQAFFTHAEVA